MKVQSPKSRFLVSAALVLSAAPLFALNPSARYEARMVYSPALHRTVLYGGSSPVDRGTKLAYEFSDTWERTLTQWVQRFPAHNPGPRAAHVMVYDPTQSRVGTDMRLPIGMAIPSSLNLLVTMSGAGSIPTVPSTVTR